MGARRRKGGRRIKRKTQKATDTSNESSELPPRAFVFSKGTVSDSLKALVDDLKHVMSPNTAQSLRARKRNKLRDFVDVAGSLHVSFFLIVSASEKNSYLRLVRSPHGPTLTFKMDAFSLSSDVAATLRKPYSPDHSIWQSAPMLVLSNFDKTVQHEALSATMLQNLFPTLNVATARLATFRRVVLVHQKPADEGGGAELRHYVIKAAPTGVSKGVKKLVRATKLPSLGKYSDVSEFLTRAGFSSDSGGETDDEEKAELPQDYVGRHARKSQKVSIKLVEIGPRISMSLLKVEEGLCDGATLFHALVHKTDDEAQETAARLEARKQLKEERRRAQNENVERKRKVQEEKAERRKRRRMVGSADEGHADDDDISNAQRDEDIDEVDDAEWYRMEVGEEPDAELGLGARSQPSKKRPAGKTLPTAAKAAAAAKRTAKQLATGDVPTLRARKGARR